MDRFDADKIGEYVFNRVEEGSGITTRMRKANQVKYCAVMTLLKITKAYVWIKSQTGRFLWATV